MLMMLRYKPTLLLLVALLHSATSRGQAINNLLSYKNISTDRYFRFNYENDVFSATDEYYTQGIHLEIVSPAMRKNPLAKLLAHPKGQYTRYGLAIEHNGYTPSSIGSDTILTGDRPFAATLYSKTFQVTINPENRSRFSSALSTGVVGGAAGAKEMQVSIHKWLNNVTPHGWQYQIHDDLIFNYEVNYEKELIAYRNNFSFCAMAASRAGTLSDKASLGVTIQFGIFDSPFRIGKSISNRFMIYAYEHPEFNLIGYDATLQGGFFNRSSPYTIASNNIKRLTFQNRFGFVVVYKGLNLEYFQSVLSREFEQQKMHVWGGIQIGVQL